MELIAGQGAVDRMLSWTYGTSPKQTHVVEWFSMTPQATQQGYMYCAILIHEAGNFDIIHHYGNVTGVSGTVGCEDANGLNATMLPQSPNMDSISSLGAGGGDDSVWHFIYGTQPNSDVFLKVNPPITEYSKLPTRQIIGMNLNGVNVRNIGLQTLSTVNIFGRIEWNGQVKLNDQTSLSNLTPGSNTTVNLPGVFTPDSMGSYDIFFSATTNPVDADTSNNNATIIGAFEVTDTIMAKDNDMVAGGIGYGQGTGSLGNVFTITQADVLTSISFWLTSDKSGDVASFSVYEWNWVDTTAGLELGVTPDYTFDGSENDAWTTVAIPPTALVAGDYLIVANQLTNQSNITLGYDNTNGLVVGTPAWTVYEQFGTSMIRVNFGVTAPPTASFSQTSLSLDATFTDLSTNIPTQWDWDFGDGNSSTDQNPVHSYTTTGDYNACLTATNFNGSDTFCDSVSVVQLPPVAAWDYQTNALSLFTTDLALYAVDWSWDFDDGNISTQQAPFHTYLQSGTYNVCQTVTNPAGTNEICIAITVTGTGIINIEDAAINIYPNPAEDNILITLNQYLEQDMTVELVNMLGDKTILEHLNKGQGGQVEIDLKNIPAGAYMLNLIGNDKVISKKLVIEK
ncbi:MAG: PKD domain-containing protein [Bacteroidetes bacterium]|nr:PKD domain-containing protein [Bacteroidota bacterium]